MRGVNGGRGEGGAILSQSVKEEHGGSNDSFRAISPESSRFVWLLLLPWSWNRSYYWQDYEEEDIGSPAAAAAAPRLIKAAER